MIQAEVEPLSCASEMTSKMTSPGRPLLGGLTKNRLVRPRAPSAAAVYALLTGVLGVLLGRGYM
jgi:hypothetical protein